MPVAVAVIAIVGVFGSQICVCEESSCVSVRDRGVLGLNPS